MELGKFYHVNNVIIGFTYEEFSIEKSKKFWALLFGSYSPIYQQILNDDDHEEASIKEVNNVLSSVIHSPNNIHAFIAYVFLKFES